MAKTIEVGLKDFSELKPEVGDRLIQFVDTGPFVVIEPNNDEQRIIDVAIRSGFEYLFSVVDGSLENNYSLIQVLALGKDNRKELPQSNRVKIIGRYGRGQERYDRLSKILRV